MKLQHFIPWIWLVATAASGASSVPPEPASSRPVQAGHPHDEALQHLAPYKRRSGVSGSLSSAGSDTLNNLMTLWAEGFRRQYPSVNIQVEGKGSSTAPPALIQGVAQLGPMSRLMKDDEVNAFQRRLGFMPTPVPVAMDALAIFVHAENPVESLTLAEVDAIFSRTRRGGLLRTFSTWSDLGVATGPARYPLSLYGRNSASGTYGLFKLTALFRGDFKNSVKELPGSAAVVLAVSQDPAAIGYAGIGYRTSGVKMLSIAPEKGSLAKPATSQNVLNGAYPLGRLLYIYVAKPPSQSLPVPVEEFLKFVLSREGQRIVRKSGYIPLPVEMLEAQRSRLW
ncbi:Phosphate-binding protein [Sulfidibacter corallicola]|uniref:Phosphate-binding protein n=1 Tax=Sulfidibacter corallicola TaxID=2818388 RepID=A0A8A4TVT5_SULCO|nr:phosphate ABC transporter substrate-binding protein [Sulfidibacter corallicola]QTD53244.1 phosphate ABC transporter substrate-binding protein [Sulfidibacter corallicola]